MLGQQYRQEITLRICNTAVLNTAVLNVLLKLKDLSNSKIIMSAEFARGIPKLIRNNLPFP